MVKTIWHGSDKIIERPEFGRGKPYNDYGLGFYCTESAEMAMEWGVGADHDGFANRYLLDCGELDILDLSQPEFGVLNWLAVLLENRTFDAKSGLALEAKEYLLANFMVDYKRADIIIGYRADDSYFAFAQDFISGAISVRQLANAMRLGKLGQQIVLKSEKAFGRIIFDGFEVAASDEWYARKMTRDRQARRDYADGERFRRQRGDIFITQIIDEEMRQDDPRLR